MMFIGNFFASFYIYNYFYFSLICFVVLSLVKENFSCTQHARVMNERKLLMEEKIICLLIELLNRATFYTESMTCLQVFW